MKQNSYKPYKAQSIQKILFYSYLRNMLILLVLATVVLSISQYTYLRGSMEDTLSRTCDSVAEDIDLQISQMDTVCLNTIHSILIKDTVYAYYNDNTVSPYQLTQYRNTLSQALYSMKGVDTSIRQVNIYDIAKGGYGAGNFTGSLVEPTTDKVWYETTSALNGHRYITPARENLLLSNGAGTSGSRLYTSLVRLYYDELQRPAGFVEVMKYSDILFARALSPSADYDIHIAVYNTDGQEIFPFDEDTTNSFNYLLYVDSDGARVKNTSTGADEFVAFAKMEYAGFTVAAAVPSSQFFAPIFRTLGWILALFIIIFIICYFIARFMAERLSAPLKKIYHFLYEINPRKRFQEIEMADTGVIEIDKLRNSLNEAMRSQRENTDYMLLLKEQELQAQMLALQSQTNPHFLYNSLNTISAMAEEGLTEPVSQMCQDITSILRYISSDKRTVSTLQEELEHCDLYLKCMKLRFGESLTYDFDIDDEILELPVPKLCIQLLVENAVKFTANTPPPWHIQINGRLEDWCWHVDVEDNGPGFDPEVSRKLRLQMDKILENGLLPSLELDGMGVLNVFIRLYLQFGFSFLFDFGTKPEGGATVTIGGKFDEKSKPL